MTLLEEVLLYLAIAAVFVPLVGRIGLGSVLGYILSGIAIGRFGFGVIKDAEAAMHFGEFGVVLLLFLVGLELQLPRLWQMRRLVFGAGGMQMAATPILLTLGLGLSGVGWGLSVLIGFALSLSSTAFALPTLAGRNELTHKYGQAAFGVLLMQDLAVIPALAALPVIAGGGTPGGGNVGLTALKTVAVLVGVGLSRFAIRPLLRLAASQEGREIFLAASLLIVMGTAYIVDVIHLSMGLGAFLAGVLLADSEYRHALEADIEPFKGLLLGLFFMGVGMSVNVPLALAQPLLIVVATLALVTIKAAVLFATGLVLGIGKRGALKLALIISQGGEFAFVIFALAVREDLLAPDQQDFFIAVVTLSMALSPFLEKAVQAVLAQNKSRQPRPDFDVEPEEDAPVIIAGFGRIGGLVARILRAKRIRFVALDMDPQHISFLKSLGTQVFYGDASRLDVLRAARADRAQVFVLAISDIERSLKCARELKTNFAHLKIVARAKNRSHAVQLKQVGCEIVIRETFFSSMKMTTEVLEELGLTFSDTKVSLERFIKHDEDLVLRGALIGDQGESLNREEMRERVTEVRRELDELLADDSAETP